MKNNTLKNKFKIISSMDQAFSAYKGKEADSLFANMGEIIEPIDNIDWDVENIDDFIRDNIVFFKRSGISDERLIKTFIVNFIVMVAGLEGAGKNVTINKYFDEVLAKYIKEENKDKEKMEGEKSDE